MAKQTRTIMKTTIVAKCEIEQSFRESHRNVAEGEARSAAPPKYRHLRWRAARVT